MPKTGLLASFGGLLCVGGGGAPSFRAARGRGVFLLALAMALGAFAFASAPALAAAPTVIGESAPSVNASEARLEAVVNPNNEVTECHFQYGETSVSEHEVQCEQSVLGGEEQGVGVTVSGLTQHTVYHYQVVLKNLKGEEVKGIEEKFTTAIPPEKPETSSPAQSITAKTATFEGVLNPKKAQEAGSYQFLFRVSPTECEGERASEPAGVMTGAAKQAVSVPVTALQPSAMYTFCLLARNGAGETAVGPAVHFTTPPAPPTIESLSVANVKTSEVTLEGVVNPNNEATECEFQYGTVSVSENTWPCKPELLKGYGGQGVSSTKLGEQGQPVEAIAGLAEGATYKYKIVVKNAAGEESKEGAFQTFEAPEAQKATAVNATTAIFNGVLNPKGERKEEPGSYEFVYRQSATECHYVLSPGQEQQMEAEHRTTELEEDRAKVAENKSTASEAATGAEKEPAKTEATGLLPGATYTFCLLIRDASGAEATLGAPETFTTGAAAPTIEGAGASDVRDTSATLQARIDPGGAPTTYTFEYAPAGGSFAPVPDGTGSVEGSAGVAVSAHLQGLSARSEYLFRVVAQNSVKTVDDEQTATDEPLSFITQATGGSVALPDGRRWEMVSPLHKEGALLGAPRGFLIEAAANGEAFSDWSFSAPIEGNAASNYGFVVQDLFGRGSQGWGSKTITSAHSAPASLPIGVGTTEYPFFSTDLSKAILQPFGQFTPLVPGVSQQTPYLRTDYLGENSGQLCESDCYDPLVNSENVPSGTQYGEEPGGSCLRAFCGPVVVAATPDLSHMLIESHAALTPGSDGGIFEWTAGRLTFVGQGHVGSGAVATHVISNDGSRVFINGSYKELEGLLMRDVATGETVRLDTPEDGLPPVAPGQARFETASSDGSRVFFKSNEPLIEGAGGGLYEYNLAAPAGERLTDLSVDRNAGEAPGVQSVIGASEDGAYVYFTANGVLAPGATPTGWNENNGCSTEPCMNLYVSHDGVTTFIAGLSGEDIADWIAQFFPFSARVSPKGHWLALTSNRDLTGYSTVDAVSGRRDEEVYLYDASTGKIVCASCDPTGARPSGVEVHKALLEGAEVLPQEDWIAGSVPGWASGGKQYDYQPRYLSDSGRLFFDSHDALVPQDVNGTGDVYEYEPPKSAEEAPPNDTCSTDSPVYNSRSDGCVSLISSGESTEESVFLDASETGGDVFFLTQSQLASQDSDNAYDIYDARECGADGSRCFAPVSASPPPCSTGDACKPAPSPQPQIFGSPASATFSGVGNIGSVPPGSPATRSLTRAQKLAKALKVCKSKKNKKKLARCLASARKLYGAAKRSTHHKGSK
jgi:hypothetical protein